MKCYAWFPILLSNLVLFLSVSDARAESIDEWTDRQLDSLVQLYIHLHTHPELSYQEKETTARIAEELK